MPKKFMPFHELIWMIARHWVYDWSKGEYMPKKRFHLCAGCRCDWHEWWHPTFRPEPKKEVNNE